MPFEIFTHDTKQISSWGKWATTKKQIVREHTYAFSAACPPEGESYSLISPLYKTAAMNKLLQVLSITYADEEIFVFADSAGWLQNKYKR